MHARQTAAGARGRSPSWCDASVGGPCSCDAAVGGGHGWTQLLLKEVAVVLDAGGARSRRGLVATAAPELAANLLLPNVVCVFNWCISDIYSMPIDEMSILFL
jgi:hypothetical protein